MKKINKTLIVAEKTTLLCFLEKELNLSHKDAKSLLTHRSVVINGNVQTKYDFVIKENDKVIIDFENKYDLLNRSRIKILHEDNELIAISKPCGMLTVSDGKSNAPTVFSVMSEYAGSKGKIFIVHRLDKETSGVLILTKKKELRDMFQQNWNRLVSERFYYAIVEGYFGKKEDVIISYLTEDKNHMVYSTDEKSGHRAETHYKVMNERDGLSLLDVSIKTGKKNQIRIAMRDSEHLIIGDKKYGSKNNLIGRLALHSYQLSLTHPLTGQQLCFTDKMPDQFMKVFKETPKNKRNTARH